MSSVEVHRASILAGFGLLELHRDDSLHQIGHKIAQANRESVRDALAKGVPGEERKISPEEEKVMHALMVEAMAEMERNSRWQPLPVVEKEAMKKLVAPVQVTASPDNYSCFDRTELEYQHALDIQPSNVMLLSNYAQFLYTVRHDNNRYFPISIHIGSLVEDVLQFG